MGGNFTVRKIGSLAAVTLFILVLSACQREEGPAEKAGKEIDKAIQGAGQAMEKAADSVRDAAKNDSK
jgi:hypothetical protein